MLTPIKSRKRSPIWKFFMISYADARIAICLVCEARISRGGQGKCATTTSLINHLKMKHPSQYDVLFQKPPKIGSRVNITASISGLVDTTERQSSVDVNGAISENYNYLIGEMIAIDNESFSFVKRVGFTRLMKTLMPQYKMPNPRYMADNVIPEIFKRIRAKIKGSISQAQAISVTSDMWTLHHKNESFLSLTAHWLSPKFIPEHGVLAIKPYNGPNIFDNIATELSLIAKQWNIPQNKIHLLVHDSEGNMIKGVQYNSVKCFFHSLQHVIQKSAEAQVEVLEMMTAARRIASHFNHSVVAQQRLKSISEDLDLPHFHLVQDVSTRWHSTYYLMERLLKLKRVVSLYATSESSFINLTPSQWELIEQCLKLLKPFEEITKLTSSGLSCVSEVIPHIVILQKYLDMEETVLMTPNLLKMRSFLKSELGKQIDFENDKYMLATFLDPRFKGNFLGTLQTEKARQKILLEFLKIGCDDGITSKSSRLTNTDTENDTTFDEIHESFWKCFDDVATAKPQNEEMNDKQAIVNEIDFYLKNAREDRFVNPCNWWSENAKLYPNLMKIYYIVQDSEGLLPAHYDSEIGFILSLQQVVQKSMNAHKELMEALATARQIVTHFNQSNIAQQKLSSIRKDLNLLGFHQLVQDVSTSWSSTYYMMEQLLEQKRPVSLYVRRYSSLVKNLSPSQWELMEQFIELLKPFEEIHKLTNSGCFYLSEVLPHVVILQKHLEKKQTADTIPDLLTMRISLQVELEREFNFDVNFEFLIATFLDPRFKNCFFGTVQMEKTRQKIVLEALKINSNELHISESESEYSPPSKRRNTNESNDAKTLEEIQESIWNCFEKVASTTDNMQTEGMEKSEIANEIDFYLQSARLDRQANPYNWWSSNANQYPNLIKFVQIYLSSPSSIVYNESLFTEPGLGYEENRNNLLQNANEEKFVFIQHNLPLIDFKY